MRRSLRNTQKLALSRANETVKTESPFGPDNEEIQHTSDAHASRRTRAKRAAQQDISEAKPRPKRLRVEAQPGREKLDAAAQLYTQLFGKPDTVPEDPTTYSISIGFPGRAHELRYHRPLLLDSPQDRTALLTWFGSVSSVRNMPWRKPWADTAATTEGVGLRRQQLERRAYEVWISEIMLQQTRVSVVIDYWNRWMARWPTIQDLAAAEPDDVLAAWRGLGYYSRATRIHDAAKLVCADPERRGLLPSNVDELVAKIPGVGRYTAGAISAIVFGKAVPMVDGNVLRVLSRQLGLFGDVKADKAIIDVLWAAADSLVKAVARDGSSPDRDAITDGISEVEETPSDRPGQWGQALMELGSTVCTPKPNCMLCPITSSCRAYAEGLQLASKKGLAPKSMVTNKVAPDIEDACALCKPFEEYAEGDGNERDTRDLNRDMPKQTKSRSRVQTTLQSFASTQQAPKTENTPTPKNSSPSALSTAAVEMISNHARKFPFRTAKKVVREEETLVCAIRRRGDARYLIHRRPAKGLLASLWELPSHVLANPQGSTPKTRKEDAERYVSNLIGKGTRLKRAKHMGELGSVPWLFSHLKLTMHVHLFELEEDMYGGEGGRGAGGGDGEMAQSRWSDVAALDAESMGTGMRKCWALVKEVS